MSLCFLSLESSKIFNKIILEKLIEEEFDGLSEALIILFPYISEDKNITASQLSKKVGYSRQAMHKNIKKLEEFDYITLNQANQKEKIIELTNKSEKLIAIANQIIKNIENDIAKMIGKKELETYKQNQIKVYEYLESIK